jgi:hypothetical protein
MCSGRFMQDDIGIKRDSGGSIARIAIVIVVDEPGEFLDPDQRFLFVHGRLVNIPSA